MSVKKTIGYVTITKEEYLGLRKTELKLTLLENGGVDNWSYYGEALNPDGEKPFNEKIEDLEKEIKENY